VLLDPARLFGAVPFPSVAYDEPAYRSGQWWRGPTWPPQLHGAAGPHRLADVEGRGDRRVSSTPDGATVTVRVAGS
jgi:hypothetical protein